MTHLVRRHIRVELTKYAISNKMSRLFLQEVAGGGVGCGGGKLVGSNWQETVKQSGAGGTLTPADRHGSVQVSEPASSYLPHIGKKKHEKRQKIYWKIGLLDQFLTKSKSQIKFNSELWYLHRIVLMTNINDKPCIQRAQDSIVLFFFSHGIVGLWSVHVIFLVSSSITLSTLWHWYCFYFIYFINAAC